MSIGPLGPTVDTIYPAGTLSESPVLFWIFAEGPRSVAEGVEGRGEADILTAKNANW